MAYTIVDPSDTSLEYVTSADVKYSGVHIGGGIYFSANHFPNPGGTHTAVPQSGLDGEAESHSTTEIDFTIPDGTVDWRVYREDVDGDGIGDFAYVSVDMSMQVGDTLSTGQFYDGPAAPILVANDPNDLLGSTVTITGYPVASSSLDGTDGTLHETVGTLTDYTVEVVEGREGGVLGILGADVASGMSGGGNYIDYDADGDGTAETYVIGTTAREYTVTNAGGVPIDTYVESASFAELYEELAAAIEGLTGADARTADDFARMTLLSAQSAGSTDTLVQGEFFHENLWGGINSDTLFGAGGDDLLSTAEGDDFLDGGTGDDTLTGGAGSDYFSSLSFGNGGFDLITDFTSSENDVLDLYQFFETLDELVNASTELPDGSVVIDLSLGTGTRAAEGGTLQINNFTTSEFTLTNVNLACFLTGTMIRTPLGELPVEALKAGDLVETLEFGPMRIGHMLSRALGRDEIHTRPNTWPVRIPKGALAPNVPNRPLSITPQHRVYLESKITDRMANGPAYAAAKHFVGYKGVLAYDPGQKIRVYHIALPEHATLIANGAYIESFFPGDQAAFSLPAEDVDALKRIFTGEQTPRHKILSAARTKQLLYRHQKNEQPLQPVPTGLRDDALRSTRAATSR